MAITEWAAKDYPIANFHLKTLVYGPPGSGKTYLFSQVKSYYIFTDKRGINDFVLNLKKFNSEVRFVLVDEYEDLVAVLTDIAAGRRAKGFDVIVLDHLTEVTEMLVRHVMKVSNVKSMDQNRWGMAVDRLKVNIMKPLLDLGSTYDIGVIAHEQIDKDTLRGDIVGLPNTIGKFAPVIGGMFDLFLYAEQTTQYVAGKQVNQFILHPYTFGHFKAKDGLSLLEGDIPNNYKIVRSKLANALNNRRAYTEAMKA